MAGPVPGHLKEMQTDVMTAHQAPWGLEINETKLTQHTVVNNMKRSLEFFLHYFVQLLLCRSDFIS